MLLDVKINNFGGSLPTVKDEDVQAFKRRNEDRRADLTAYLTGKTNLLDASLIEQHLFPLEQVDVFLSHSHQDHDKVVRLAVALEDLGLKVFVDSCVWGDAYTLLKDVDDMHSVNTSEANTYFYSKVTRTTANVYMILNVALQRMIDRCELFLFLASDASTLTMEQYVDGPEYVGSPWVFSELAFASTVARRARAQPSMENLFEVVGKTEDAALPPIVRYEMPPSSHAMDWSQLQDVMRTQARLQTSRGKDKLAVLDAVYHRLDLSAMEKKLIDGTLSDPRITR